MWKPGTAKPKSATPRSQTNASHQGLRGGSNGSLPAKKKLSTSTMAMRFMHRKNDTNVTNPENNKASLPMVSAKPNKRSRDTAAYASNSHEDITITKEIRPEDEQSASSDGVVILELASSVDMHGIGSDIVGRRSFGGFHKAIRTTWEAALKRRIDDDATTRNTKSRITDEKLLDRYEKYVQGGRMVEGSGFGNKGRQRKRKHDPEPS